MRLHFKFILLQGSPEFTEVIAGDDSCQTVFEFVTTEACKNGVKNKVTEIPCYVYEEKTNKKIDLSPLIKLGGTVFVNQFILIFHDSMKD